MPVAKGRDKCNDIIIVGEAAFAQFLAILLFLVVFFITPDTLIAKRKIILELSPARRFPPPVTGFIDRIGPKEIVINDTWFKLSENVSVSGLKKGDLVTFVANSDRELIKIQRAKKRKQLKE